MDQKGRVVINPNKLVRAQRLIEFLAKLGVRSADARAVAWRDDEFIDMHGDDAWWGL